MSKILLIGAGAVGQAYGFHLSRGGADITYFVREKYLEELSLGLTIECLSGSQKGKQEFHNFNIMTHMSEVRPCSGMKFGYVYPHQRSMVIGFRTR